MKIGIVIAILRELNAFLEKGYETTVIKEKYHEVYKTNINGNEIYAVRSGYGEIDAAAATQLLITRFGCETILNFGVVGGLTPEMALSKTCIVEKVVHYDYDISSLDSVRPGQYSDLPDEFIPADPVLFRKARVLMPDLREAIL